MTAPGEVRNKAVRGALWTIVTGLGTRVLQIVGTLALLNLFKSVEDKQSYGEAQGAAIVALTAHTFTSFGVPHYLVSHKTDRAANWHATIVLASSGVVAMAIALLFHAQIGAGFQLPRLMRYLPWLVLSTFISRIALVPERLLQQRLQFREAARARALGELAYTFVTVALAWRGWGGMAVVAGNVARSVLSFIALSRAMSPREWAVPHKYDRPLLRDMMVFGFPLGLAYGAGTLSRNGDNLIVSALFGPAVMGAYNYAYNFADMPASQIGEQVGDVLTPSFIDVDEEARKRGLVRATGLVGVVVFPLAIGLGVTGPTALVTLMNKDSARSWSDVGPMLTVLAAFSVLRPIPWNVAGYLQAIKRPRAVMWLTALRLAAIVACVAGFGVAGDRLFGGLYGPLGSCLGAFVASLIHAVASSWVVVRIDGVSGRGLFMGTLRPIAACIPLVLGVYGARAGIAALDVHVRGLGLVAEIVAGAIGYGVGVLVFARALALDMIGLLKEMRRKRAARGAAPALEAAAPIE